MLPRMLPVPWSATHRLTFTPSDGSTAETRDVRLIKDSPNGRELWFAQTRAEHDGDIAPSWFYVVADKAWLWRGLSGPNGRAGAVTCTPLTD